MAEIKAGDEVVLKSGGPVMTVETAGQGRVSCSWFDAEKRRHKEEFAVEAVKLYTGEKGSTESIDDDDGGDFMTR